MANIPHDQRINRRLKGDLRKRLEAGFLAIDQWSAHPEMPPECWDVATGEAFYPGCEGIGFDAELGWYLVLWEPSVEMNDLDLPLGNTGLTLVGAQICGGPTEKDPGTVTLLYVQNPDAECLRFPGEKLK